MCFSLTPQFSQYNLLSCELECGKSCYQAIGGRTYTCWCSTTMCSWLLPVTWNVWLLNQECCPEIMKNSIPRNFHLNSVKLLLKYKAHFLMMKRIFVHKTLKLILLIPIMIAVRNLNIKLYCSLINKHRYEFFVRFLETQSQRARTQSLRKHNEECEHKEASIHIQRWLIAINFISGCKCKECTFLRQNSF